MIIDMITRLLTPIKIDSKLDRLSFFSTKKE